MPVVKRGQNFSGTPGTMVTRAPWPAPMNKYYVIRKLVVTNTTSVTSGGAAFSLAIWDQDLSNTTPTARGSGLLPLITVPLNGSQSGGAGSLSNLTVLGQDQMPPEMFQAGITMTTTNSAGLLAISGINVSMELEVV